MHPPEPCHTEIEINRLSDFASFEIRYQHINENTGYGEGLNRLDENCGCDYVLGINPDIGVGRINWTFF